MKDDNNKNSLAIYIIILGTFFTAILGFSFKHWSIFHTTDPGFQFIIYGICGSILMAIIHLSTIKNFIIGLFSLLLLTVILFNIRNFQLVFVRFLFLVAIALAIFIYHRYYYFNLIKLSFGKFLPLSALLFITNLILVIVVVILTKSFNIRELMIDQAGYGFFIGTGIGLGLELSFPIKRLFRF